MHAEDLSRMDFEGAVHFLQHVPRDIDEAALFAAIESIVISPASCERALRNIEDPFSETASSLVDCSTS
jgi:hypothetical protein